MLKYCATFSIWDMPHITDYSAAYSLPHHSTVRLTASRLHLILMQFDSLLLRTRRVDFTVISLGFISLRRSNRPLASLTRNWFQTHAGNEFTAHRHFRAPHYRRRCYRRRKMASTATRSIALILYCHFNNKSLIRAQILLPLAHAEAWVFEFIGRLIQDTEACYYVASYFDGWVYWAFDWLITLRDYLEFCFRIGDW
jgi:hypothetical protein